MHHPIFGYSFAVLVAPVLLFVLAFYFLNKKRTGVCRNAEDVDTGASGSMAAPTETNSDGSSLSPTKANNGTSSLMAAPTETNSDGSSPSPTKANNGASNSLTGNCYEVFLSFRGPDTRYGFTDHLYKGLIDAGIDAFRDDDELCHGKDIRPVLMEAITSSKILIPIFSVNYGTSSWCLDELVQMMERKKNNGQIVLPIFYKVKPAEVRYQKGRFGEAFHERESRLLERSSFNPTTLEKWKSALDEVSTLKGYEANGYEVKLVKLIVREVLSELKKKFDLVISENLVGIDSHVKKVMEFMDNKSHATLFIGIHGMGGIGKTTLAKAIYNKLSNQFDHRSFIADIRESWKRDDVHYLQNQLIYDILKRENEVHSENEGTKFISSKFKGKKVLVLLDDVDNVVQLKRLAGNRDWFSSGSRIIITTRNKRILEEVGADYAYDHKEMDNEQSLILFSKHAFRRDSPPREFKDLSHEVVSITGGLPLSLEVFGSLLCGKESRQWKDTTKKLKKVPHTEVQERLKISYKALDYRQQQIFLDIACFFIGTDKRIASYMWDACDFFPGEGIEVLRFMSLIKIGNDHELRMHDQLRDLGREIVREEDQGQPRYRSRLWDSEEVLQVLKENKGTEKIEAIILSEGSSEGSDKIDEQDGEIFTEKQFKNLTSLRFLHVKGAHLCGDFKDSIEGLRWLRWRKCPMDFGVKNLHVKKLAVLELSESNINEKWEGWSSFMMAKNLKFLNLTSCQSLENTNFLSAFKNLEVLILNFCWRLEQIDSSIGDMKALLRLELCCCTSLKELPTEIGELKALKQLFLMDNPRVSTLPNSIGSLQNLEILRVSGSFIEELPNSIRRLRKLRELDASRCHHLGGKMPESMCNLSFLQRLDVRGCIELQSLSDLPFSLTYLGITCQSRKLPSLSHLVHLKELRVIDCKFLESIPELPSTLLKNSECSQLTEVEESELPQSINSPFKLEFLEICGCKLIETLDVSQLNHLRTLSIRSCRNILEVQGLAKLQYLESLTVANCYLIEQLDLPKFKGLKILDVRRCHNLVKIQGLDRLEFLENLNISGCISIESLLLPKSESMKILDAGSCKKLAEIQGLDRLEILEMLNIQWCTSIKKLHLPKSRSLKILDAKCCDILVEIQGLNRLEFLEELNISKCVSIEKLDLPKSGSLKKLDARDCENLTEIQGLDRLEFLEQLNIFGCTSIERLDLPKSEHLTKLVAHNCNNLVEIQGIDRLELLEKLDISECSSIERLNLQKCENLEILKVVGCKNLIEIEGLDRLELLEVLDISECASIERLNLPKSKNLKILNVVCCKSLIEIQGLDRLELSEMMFVQF